jgi:hypothetical protein
MSTNIPEPPVFTLLTPPPLPTLPSAPALPTATTSCGTLVLGSVEAVTSSLIITGLADCNALTTFNIEQHATLGLEATLTADVLTTVNFAGAGGTLILSPGFRLDIGSQITNFGPGDKIDYLASVAHLTTCYSPAVEMCGAQISPAVTTVNLTNACGQTLGSLRLVGDYRSNLGLQPDGHGGTEIVCYCLLAGTRILTRMGEVAVEDLRPGAVVQTPDGPREVTWVGAREMGTADDAAPESVRPIRIAAGAFGPGLPVRDLRVSPDHAIYVDGVMIPAKHLVNGSTVTRDRATTRPHYVHVELAQHGVLYAEGLTVESFLDVGGRDGFFEGAAATPALHPDVVAAAWEARGYAPMVVTGPALEAVRRRLADRAAVLAQAWPHAA